MKCWVSHYCVRNSRRGERNQNAMCSISELVRVGKEDMRQNPCAFCGASPCFHFLPDLIWLLSLPNFSWCLFSILFCICSIRTNLFCFLFLHFHRQMTWLWICPYSVPQEAISLLKFGVWVLKCRIIHPQHPGCLQTFSQILYKNTGKNVTLLRVSLCSQPAVPYWGQCGVEDTL